MLKNLIFGMPLHRQYEAPIGTLQALYNAVILTPGGYPEAAPDPVHRLMMS